MAMPELGLHTMVSHLPAMLPVAAGNGARIQDPGRQARRHRLVRRGVRRAGRRARGDELRRRPPAARWSSSATTTSGRTRRRPTSPTRSSTSPTAPPHTGSRGSWSTGPTCSRSTARRSRAIEKAREGGGPDAARVPDAPHGGPCRPRRRLLRAEGDVREVGRVRPDRALPHVAVRQRRDDGGRGERDDLRRQAPAQRRARPRRGVPAARSRRRSRAACSHRSRTSTRPTTSSHGRDDVHPGDLGRAAARDAARPARLHPRRGRRRLRRGVQGLARIPGGVRPVARDRHAALRDGDRRRRHRRGADGPAPRRRDAVRRLHLVRVGSPRDRGGEAVLPRADARADRRAAAVGRRILRAGRSTRRTRRPPSRTSPG